MSSKEYNYIVKVHSFVMRIVTLMNERFTSFTHYRGYGALFFL